MWINFVLQSVISGWQLTKLSFLGKTSIRLDSYSQKESANFLMIVGLKPITIYQTEVKWFETGDFNHLTTEMVKFSTVKIDKRL